MTSRIRTYVHALIMTCVTVSFVFFVALGFVAATVAPAVARTSADLGAELDVANRELVGSLESYARAYSDYIAAVQARETATAEVATINEQIDRLNEELSIRAAQMYRQGPFSAIEMLLGVTSFQEFTATWDILTKMNEQNTVAIEQMQALKQQRSQLLIELDRNEQLALTLMNDIENQASQLGVRIASIEQSIDTLRAQEAQTAAEAETAARYAEELRIAQMVITGGRPGGSNPNSPAAGQHNQNAPLGDGRWDSTILASLGRHGVDSSWLLTIRNIIWRESTNRPESVSPCGTWVGLCQFNAQWDPPRGWSGVGDWRLDPLASIDRLVQYLSDTGNLGNHWAATNH
ncbi:MAG: hypothetical protein FWG78_04430 [Coriobacteriia bacterium]|nr:hypothetical protein [Coriobacteriia bacterium]